MPRGAHGQPGNINRKLHTEDQLILDAFEYPEPPPNLQPEIRAKFLEIVRSVPAAYWRKKAELAAVLALARTEYLLDRAFEEVYAGPLTIGEAETVRKVNPAFNVYMRMSSHSNALRIQLGLTIQSAQMLGERTLANRKADMGYTDGA